MATVSRRRNRYVVDWRDASGRRRWKSFEKKKDANAHLHEVAQQARRGIVVDETLKFKSLVKHYRTNHVETHVRPKTKADYEGLLDNHLVPHFGEWKIRDIQRQAVLDFRSGLLEQDVGRRTVNKALGLLGAVFRYGMLNGQAHHNPAIKTKLPKEQAADYDSDDVQVLSLAEQRKLIQAAEGRWRALIMTALSTGLRQGELLGLKWGDLDFRSKTIHVRRQYSAGQFAPLKTKAARRMVPIPPHLVRKLKTWKLQCPKGDHDLVFPNGSGNPENAANVLNRGLLPALRRAKLRRIRFHDLRHCYVSMLIASGVQNIKRIQALVGHTSAMVTLDTYGHLLPDDDADIGAKVNAALFGDSGGSKTVAVDAGQDDEDPQVVDFIGGPCRDRTCDHLIKSRQRNQ